MALGNMWMPSQTSQRSMTPFNIGSVAGGSNRQYEQPSLGRGTADEWDQPKPTQGSGFDNFGGQADNGFKPNMFSSGTFTRDSQSARTEGQGILPGDMPNRPRPGQLPNGPYGTGVPAPGNAPRLPKEDRSGRYGTDHVLTLDDLNNPNLTLDDRLYLAGLYVYYNPGDEAGWQNYFNWKKAIADRDASLHQPPSNTPTEPPPPPEPVLGPNDPGYFKYEQPAKWDYGPALTDEQAIAHGQQTTNPIEYAKKILAPTLNSPPPMPRWINNMNSEFGLQTPNAGAGRSAWDTYKNELAYYWPDFEGSMPGRWQGKFNPFGDSPIA